MEHNKLAKILIAEDDEISYKYLEHVLRNNGYHTLRAKTGDEALDLLSLHTDISLVLMDIKMPGLDGYETTRRIKNRFPYLPVIAQTAYALIGDREKALKSGCDEYLSKPVDGNLLLKMVGSFLG